MALGTFDEGAYDGDPGDGMGDGDDRSTAVDTRPCPGPPHHNPRCCLMPAHVPMWRRALRAMRKARR